MDPSSLQEAEYTAVNEAHGAAIAALVEGAPMSAAYNAALQVLKVGPSLMHLTIDS